MNRLRYDTASEMLGVWPAPDGNHTQIMAEVKESAIEWEQKLDLVILLIMKYDKLYTQIYLLS